MRVPSKIMLALGCPLAQPTLSACPLGNRREGAKLRELEYSNCCTREYRRRTKLECVLLKVTVLQSVVKFVRSNYFAEWRRDGKRTAKGKCFAYTSTTYAQIWKVGTYESLNYLLSLL